MTLNDFKALEGDRAHRACNSLPVTLGPERAARVACVVMAVPQVVVIALLLVWDRPLHAAAIAVLLLLQVAAMRRAAARSQGQGAVVQRHRGDALRRRHDGRRLRAARSGGAAVTLSWVSIVRLGLVQTGAGRRSSC